MTIDWLIYTEFVAILYKICCFFIPLLSPAWCKFLIYTEFIALLRHFCHQFIRVLLLIHTWFVAKLAKLFFFFFFSLLNCYFLSKSFLAWRFRMVPVLFSFLYERVRKQETRRDHIFGWKRQSDRPFCLCKITVRNFPMILIDWFRFGWWTRLWEKISVKISDPFCTLYTLFVSGFPLFIAHMKRALLGMNTQLVPVNPIEHSLMTHGLRSDERMKREGRARRALNERESTTNERKSKSVNF